MSYGYKLPNGCYLTEVGSRVRVPEHHIWLIPSEDIEKYGIELDEEAYSDASEVLIRTK